MIVDNIDQARAHYYEQYGTFLFIGIFLSILFLIAASLIIYYKQITEGFDDRERYQIMKKCRHDQRRNPIHHPKTNPAGHFSCRS